MELFFVSFLAGILTVLAPCVLPILPVIIAGSVSEKSKKRPFIIILSLAVSIFIFTFLLKVSTSFIGIPQYFWSFFSGIIIFLFGIFSVFPNLWFKISYKLGFDKKSHSMLESANKEKGVFSDIFLGMALGPVFSSCSPTFSLILAVVLPQSFFIGSVNLLIYIFGLCLILFLIAIFGQKIISKLKFFADPNGSFKKILGIVLVLVGIFIMFGLDKKIETSIIETGVVDGILDFEQNILEKFK